MEIRKKKSTPKLHSLLRLFRGKNKEKKAHLVQKLCMKHSKKSYETDKYQEDKKYEKILK